MVSATNNGKRIFKALAGLALIMGSGLIAPVLSGCSEEAEVRRKAKKAKAADADLGRYINSVQKNIAAGVVEKIDPEEPGSGALAFEVNRDGTVSDVSILKSTGSKEFDNSLVKVLAETKLPAPPSNKDKLKVHFTLDRRVLKDPLLSRNADLNTALKTVDEELKAQPGDINLLWERGNLYLLTGDSRALADLNSVVAAHRFGDEAFLARARAYEDAADWKHCRADCLAALALNPHSLEAMVLLTDAYRHCGELDRAIATIDGALQESPDSADALASRAYIYLVQRDFIRAIADCNRAIAADPRCVAALAYRGDARSELDDFQNALKDYSKAVDLDPDEPSLLLRRAELFNDLGQYSKAVVDCTAAIKLDADNGEAYFCRAFANKELGFNAQAKVDQVKALRLGFNPSSN